VGMGIKGGDECYSNGRKNWCCNCWGGRGGRDKMMWKEENLGIYLVNSVYKSWMREVLLSSRTI
jgi:hypothetical protein